jgi:hypothetical protein
MRSASRRHPRFAEAVGDAGVTLIEVIAQTFVTVVVKLGVAEARSDSPAATATISPGATASGAVTVTATPDRFVAGSWVSTTARS